MRIGQGYDAHRMVEGRPCVICGEVINYPFGPDGHSDGDVPVHALIDALLGAAALGDIGRLFPDCDDKYLGISSILLLKETGALLAERGYRLVNADVTIVAQRPKLSQYIDKMRHNLASALSVEDSCISVKATTEEGMGFTGDCSGISAHAVVLIESL